MNSFGISVRFLGKLVALGVLGASGCSSVDPAEQTGQVDVNLVGQAPSGATYRLRDGIISVDGVEGSIVLDTESDPDGSSLSATLPVGAYESFLFEGWRLERFNPDGSVSDVEAELVSANPDRFDIFENQSTEVALRFLAGSDEVVTGNGSLDIVLDVEERATGILSPCPSPSGGAFRDCGWSMAIQNEACTPGATVLTGCGCGSGGQCAGDPVLRVCEGSGSCSAEAALALVDDSCGLCPEIVFSCPASGHFSVLVGAFSSGAPFSCAPIVQ